MKRIDITTEGWEEYRLIDSGEGRKLEQFGTMLLDRPDPQTLWNKSDASIWVDATAQFLWSDKGLPAQAGERWKFTEHTKDTWTMSWQDMTLSLSCRGFKHIGIFPEHAHQWERIQSLGKKHDDLRMLNLFGYTGAASIVGALAGMRVTHVDASKSTIDTVKENSNLSHVPTDSIRLICEDALKYTKRLVQRGEQFDVVIMDPPAFGRGPKGEVWKIEESLHELLTLIPQVLSPNAKLVILNGYASGYSARTFGELLQEIVPSGDITYGDIGIQEHNTDRILSTGIYASWQAI